MIMKNRSRGDDQKFKNKKNAWVIPTITLMSVMKTEAGKVGAVNEYSVNGPTS